MTDTFVFKVNQGKVAGGLIELPLSYYSYYSHENSKKLIYNGREKNIPTPEDLILTKVGENYIIKYEPWTRSENNPLTAGIIVNKESIIGQDRNDIITLLDSSNVCIISVKDIQGDRQNFALELSCDGKKGILNFINFNDLNNEILKDGYFTIKREGIGYVGCISDENGNCQKLIRSSNFLYQIPIDSIGHGQIDPAVFHEIANADEESNGNVSKNLAVLLREDSDKVLAKLKSQNEYKKVLSILKSNTEIFQVMKNYIVCDGQACDILAEETIYKLIKLLNEQDIGKKLIEGITNKFTPAEAKSIVDRTVREITSAATRENNPDPEAFKKYEKFAEKLAELLVNKSNITPEGAETLVRNKVSEWALAKYLLLHSNLGNVDSALPFVRQEIDQEKLVAKLLEYAELNRRNPASTTVKSIADNFLETKKAEIAQAILEEKHQGKGILASDPNLQQGVAAQLRIDPGNAKGPKGKDADPLEVVNRLKQDAGFKQEVRGDNGRQGLQGPIGLQGETGPKGEDANHLEIVNRLKNDSALQQGVAVELRANPGAARGPQGDPGPVGPKGEKGKTGPAGQNGRDGPAGQNVNPEDVAAQLVTSPNLNILSAEVAKESELQTQVAAQLRTNPGNAKGLPGEKGEAGPIGPQGPKGDTGSQGLVGSRGEDGPQGSQGEIGPIGPQGETGPKGEDANHLEIVNRLKNDSALQQGVAVELRANPGAAKGPKGDPGPAGPKGEKGDTGQPGQNVNPEDVAAQLVTGSNLDELSTAVAQKSELQTQVAEELRTNPGNAQGPQGATGKDGLPGENGRDAKLEDVAVQLVTDSKQSFTLQQGDELPDGNYEASIVLNGKPVATLPKIGYYMLSGELVIRNHITKEEVKIPKDFHCLKVTKSSSNDDYQLTFCNFLGNEFFEYKKYDPQYSSVPDEYRRISLNFMKKEYNPKFCKLLSHQPSFSIKEGVMNPDSPDHYSADVVELTNKGKSRKVATLIDQFGFFNKEGKFQYYDYHTETKPSAYDSYEISKGYIATDINNEFYFNDTMILYTTPEL